MLGRVLTPEIMDDPAIESDRHARALRGLARINAISLAALPIVNAVRKAIPPGPVRLLDVATGSGDVAYAVAKALAKRGYDCSFTLTDISDRALELARRRFGDQNAETVILDATADALPESDVVMCSLFLHHLSEDQALSLLSSMSSATRELLVVNDLRRTRVGIALAGVVPRILTRSDVVHVDAVKSARSAFTLHELASLAENAGLAGFELRRVPPSRMALRWKPNR
ncbi:MAG: methyltransferase domain-containing protein [Phycisphaera sp.]|nr:MAG: methyltransferase domain-containing protein [Phycisphaera sp.]